jgi:hypothetical protein
MNVLCSVVGKPRFHWNGATILTEAISAVEAWKVRISMFLRHNPSSLCNTTGALLVVTLSPAISSALREMLFGRQGILASKLTGCVKLDPLSNFALLYSGASRQPA